MSSNVYTWSKDGTSIAQEEALIIESVSPTDTGIYHFQATNPEVPNLTLSGQIDLKLLPTENIPFDTTEVIVSFSQDLSQEQADSIDASLNNLGWELVDACWCGGGVAPRLRLYKANENDLSRIDLNTLRSSRKSRIASDTTEVNYFLEYIPADSVQTTSFTCRISELPDSLFSLSSVVAVLDSGVDPEHPDLASGIKENLFPNSDGNCIPDDRFGYDFHRDTILVVPGGVHGSHVAGILLSESPASQDVRQQILNVKVYEDTVGVLFDVVCAIHYAVDLGADVINVSLGYESERPSRLLYDAINRARDSSIIVVVSAGNEGINLDTLSGRTRWPGGFATYTSPDSTYLPLDNIIVVGALDATLSELANFSNHGNHSVHIAAPGTGIRSTGLDGEYLALSGTSQAAAFVSRVIAIIRAHQPDLSYQQIIGCLRQSAAPIASSNPLAWGRLDEGTTLSCLGIGDPTEPNPEVIRPYLNAILPACGETNGVVALNPKGGSGQYTYSWDNGSNEAIISSLSPGPYSVTISDGNNKVSLEFVLPHKDIPSPAGPNQDWLWNSDLMGGNQADSIFAVARTADGGLIMVGTSRSFSSQGDAQGWMVKLTAEGLVDWEKNFGGPLDDALYTVRETQHNTYIAVGMTGDPEQGADVWILEVNENIEIQQVIQGSDEEQANDILLTSDNGFLVLGQSQSSRQEGKISLSRFNSSGVEEWRTVYGEAGLNEGNTITPDGLGGYLIAGSTTDTEDRSRDALIIRIDSAGNPLWKKRFGGDGTDMAFDIRSAFTGGFVVVGSSTSKTGNGISENQGREDGWMIFLDEEGHLCWAQNYGSDKSDMLREVIPLPDGSFLAAGTTHSIENGRDFWLLRLDAAGIPTWEETYGDKGDEAGFALELTVDGGIVLAGVDARLDAQVLKLSCVAGATESVSIPTEAEIKIFPNPATGTVTLQIDDPTERQLLLQIFDLRGKLVKQQVFPNPSFNKTEINLSRLPKGMYLFKFYRENATITKKVIRQ